MKKTFLILLAVSFFAAALPSFAKDEKCTALSKLASTIYSNRATVNEYQMLRGIEFKSKPIDFAFIKLFSGMAYTLNTLPADQFQAVTDDFCQSLITTALTPNSQTSRTDVPTCKSLVDHSVLINSFRKSGDNPTSLRRLFDKTYSDNNFVHRITADYLNLMAEMRFSNLFDAASDESFINFSKGACNAFSVYIGRVEKKR